MEKVLTKEILSTVFIILFASLTYIIIKKILTETLMKKAKHKHDKKRLTILTLSTNIIKYAIMIITLLMVLDAWGVDTKALLASVGIVGVVAGLALQDLLKDIIGGTTIITESQFKVGDDIKIGDFRGTVISLGMKTTKIRAYTGEVKFIANRNITEVINYSLMPLKCILDVSTSYEDDINKVEKSLNNVCKRLSKTLEYLKSPIEVLGVQELSDSAITFRIVADTKPANNYEFKRLLQKEIVKEFEKNNLTIPYPQLEVHNDTRI